MLDRHRQARPLSARARDASTTHTLAPMANASPPTAPATIRDVVDSLAWPQLLKTWRFALRPSNMIFAAGLLTLLLLLVRGADAIVSLFEKRAPSTTLLRSIDNALTFPPPRSDWITSVTFRAEQVLQLITDKQQTFALLLLVLPASLVIALLGGAISRSTAEMWTQPSSGPWPMMLGISLRRIASSAASLLGPLVVLAMGLGLLSIVGYAFALPFVRGAAGIAFGFASILSLVMVLVLSAYVLTLPMLVPANMIEGTDAIDSVQRCLAYAFAKPVRLAAYWLVLFAQGAALVWVVGTLCGWTLKLSSWAFGGFLPEDIARAATLCILRGKSEGSVHDLGFAAHALCFWSKLVQSVPVVAGVSYSFAAGTLLYGTMRRVCDGQDASEIFDPIAAQRVEDRTLASHASDDSARAGNAARDAEEQA